MLPLRAWGIQKFFFTWFCCVACLGVCFCHLISAIEMRIGEGTPGDGSWKCPVYPQSCVSDRFLPPRGRWGCFSSVSAGKNPFHHVTPIPLCRQWWFSQHRCWWGLVLLHFPCLPGGVTQPHKGRKKPLYLFPSSRKNAFLMWVEGEWVVLLGWLGNTAFM